MTFELSESTVSILKNFATINQSLLFNEGNALATISNSKAIIAKANIVEDIPETFGIYDLGKFLSVLSLFESPKLQATDKVVTISSGAKKINYTCADKTLILGKDKLNPYEKKLALPKIDVSFVLPENELNDIMKAAAVLKVDNIVVLGNEGKLSIQAMDIKNPTGDVYSLNLCDTEHTFKFIFRKDNLKLVPGEYNVDISSKRISRFVSADGNLEYFIAIEDGSTFTE
jgi:hypothetical protein